MSVIRSATGADSSSIISVLTAAYWDEEGIGQYFHPLRNEFPDDLKEFWRRMLRQEWYDWQNALVVAENEKGEIVGFASWLRIGKSAQTQVLGNWDPRQLSVSCSNFISMSTSTSGGHQACSEEHPAFH